jgi:hypothetical protein
MPVRQRLMPRALPVSLEQSWVESLQAEPHQAEAVAAGPDLAEPQLGPFPERSKRAALQVSKWTLPPGRRWAGSEPTELEQAAVATR